MRRTLAAAAALALWVMPACGGDDTSVGPAITTLPPLPTSTVTTTAAPGTSVASSTSTSSTTSSSPSTTSTSTTVAPGAALLMTAVGLGDASFGLDPEPTIDYVQRLLGPPTADSGWIDSFSPFGTCPGTTVRGVRWGDLLLLFGDESEESTGRLHFFAYQYGPAAGLTPSPLGPAMPGGISIGSTVDELRTAFPEVQLFSDEVFGSGFIVEQRLSGNLTSTVGSGFVTAVFGGIGCGE